jgi:hypothetical protein
LSEHICGQIGKQQNSLNRFPENAKMAYVLFVLTAIAMFQLLSGSACDRGIWP